MAASNKYPARDALGIIDGPLALELDIHRFDDKNRSKAQLFSVGGPRGRQFAIILGNTDVITREHSAKQTKILLERCELPEMQGIKAGERYNGDRIKKQRDSRLAHPNQTSCLVTHEQALKNLLRWYAGKADEIESKPTVSSRNVERPRVEKAAADVGFDLPVSEEKGWLVFRSTRFPLFVGVAIKSRDRYCLGVSDADISVKVAPEFKITAMIDAAPWQALFDEFEGYITLQQILQRLAHIATIIKKFSANTAKLPDNTEAHRLVKQRIGQEIFRESLMDYWGGRCSATGLDMPELLRASHIKPWAKCETDVERLDVFNGCCWPRNSTPYSMEAG